MNTINYDTYLDLIEEEKYREATEYKSSCIPDVLYKYFWLDDDEEKNEMRLSTLERGEIYLSTLEQFNDPFEGHVFVFEDDESAPKGLRKENLEDFINQINSHARICCFANPSEKHQNMPMWAYYANNHRGFCVEYKISNRQKKFLYPVSYDPFRVNGNHFISNLIIGIIQMVKEGKDSSQMSGEMSVYNHLAYLSLTCKHRSWRHENEIRALVPTELGIYFPAIPNKIYMGMNCSDEHKKRFLEIVEKFPEFELYKLQGIPDDTNFNLREVRIK